MNFTNHEFRSKQERGFLIAARVALFVVTVLHTVLASALSGGTQDTNTPQNNATFMLDAGGCTAVLIAPRFALTAGHCFGKANETNPPPVVLPDVDEGGNPNSDTDDGNNWEVTDDWYRPYVATEWPLPQDIGQSIKRRRGNEITAGFGPNGSLFTTLVVGYSPAGLADHALILLARPVPSNIATPVPILTRVPTVNYPAVLTAGTSGEAGQISFDDAVGNFWRGKRFQIAGYGGASVRRVSTATFREFPMDRNTDRHKHNKIRVNVASNATVVGGDSGGPLFWTDNNGTTFLVGIHQGNSANGRVGRYTATFSIGGFNGDGKLVPNMSWWHERAMAGRRFFNPNIDQRFISWSPFVQANSGVVDIAVCDSGDLIGFKRGSSLWKNNLINPRPWRELNVTLPPNISNITCSGSTLFFLTDPGRRSGYIDLNSMEVSFVGSPNSASRISALKPSDHDFPVVWALNDNKSLWRNSFGMADDQWEKKLDCPPSGCATTSIKDIAATDHATFALSTRNGLSINGLTNKTRPFWYMIPTALAQSGNPIARYNLPRGVNITDISAEKIGVDKKTRLVALTDGGVIFVGVGAERVYSSPSLGGTRLDWCFLHGNACGRKPAEAFCGFKGYDTVVSFTRETGVHVNGIRTLVLGEKLSSNRRYCDGSNSGCDAFSSITCSHSLEQ